jgi:hypothetical protein
LNNHHAYPALVDAAAHVLLQLMASMPLKPSDISYAPRADLVNDRNV